MEPLLKYLKFDTTEESISTIASCSKFKVAGTVSGELLFLDLNGNLVRRVQEHTALVSQVCINTSMDFVGSCSLDGTILLQPVTPASPSEKLKYTCESSILGMVVSPYATASIQSVAFCYFSQSSRVVLSERGWFGGSRDTILFQGTSRISSLVWHSNFISWSTDTSVEIYDYYSRQVIYRHALALPPSRLPSYLHFQPSATSDADVLQVRLKRAGSLSSIGPMMDLTASDLLLYAGSGNSLSVLEIKPAWSIGSPSMTSGARVVKYSVSVYAKIETDFVICGISCFMSHVILLAYPVSASSSDRLVSVRILNDEFHQVGNDLLSFTADDLGSVEDYRLIGGAEELFVLAQSDVWTATSISSAEKVDWLVSRNQYDQVLAMPPAELYGVDMSSVRNSYMNHLFGEGLFLEAARKSLDILGADVELWNRWVFAFAELGKLDLIASFVPVPSLTAQSTIRLVNTAYEMILVLYMSTNPQLFLHCVTVWPADIYESQVVFNALTDTLAKTRKGTEAYCLLIRAAALFHLRFGNEELFLECSIDGLDLSEPNSPNVDDLFGYVKTHSLYSLVIQKLDMFVKYDAYLSKKTPSLAPNLELISTLPQFILLNPEHFPLEKMLDLLTPFPQIKLQYLHAVYLSPARTPMPPALKTKMHTSLVGLYATHAPKYVLNFLRDEEAMYELAVARDVCLKAKMGRELIYVLARMGNMRDALRTLLEMGEFRLGVEFVRESGDEELWGDLVEFGKSKSVSKVGGGGGVGAREEFVCVLIDEDVHVPEVISGLNGPISDRLKKSIAGCLEEYRLRVVLLDGCKSVFVTDASKLMKEYFHSWKRGVSIDISTFATGSGRGGGCLHCERGIGVGDEIVVFRCGHLMHLHCASASTGSAGGPAAPLKSPVFSKARGSKERLPSAPLPQALTPPAGVKCTKCN